MKLSAFKGGNLIVGDVVIIAGVYDDGTCEANDTPRDLYDMSKRTQKWRVRYVGPEGVRLQPLNQDKSVQEFNDTAGEFWIRPNGR